MYSYMILIFCSDIFLVFMSFKFYICSLICFDYFKKEEENLSKVYIMLIGKE